MASSTATKLKRKKREVALVEYQATQDSAQHHDNLVWNVSSFTWAGSAVLMGFVLSGLHDASSTEAKLALLCVAIVGVILALCIWRWAYQLRGIKVEKYNRCKNLEEQLGMEQHLKLNYSAGSQTKTYAVLMVMFLVAWLVLIVLVICAQGGPDKIGAAQQCKAAHRLTTGESDFFNKRRSGRKVRRDGMKYEPTGGRPHR